MKKITVFLLIITVYICICLAENKSQFKKVEIEDLNLSDQDKWNTVMKEYTMCCDKWETKEEFSEGNINLQLSLPIDEVKLILEDLSFKIRRQIIEKVICYMNRPNRPIGKYNPDEDFFFEMTYDLLPCQLKHIGVIEAIFETDCRFQRFVCYDDPLIVLIDGKLRECLPDKIYHNNCKKKDEHLKDLDKSKVYIQIIPQKNYKALILYIPPADGQPKEFGAWWRFVFFPLEANRCI
ncbi:MAG: hypothetical protein GYA51_15385 [Candidatus Methanofastidiosa archaeon]|nr:hypothetical protein [Candidatus Methanofastidiosa archaeon]